jgi:hypothetical protein
MRIALGPMSTPRRLAPKSLGKPMIRIFLFVSMEDSLSLEKLLNYRANPLEFQGEPFPDRDTSA